MTRTGLRRALRAAAVLLVSSAAVLTCATPALAADVADVSITKSGPASVAPGVNMTYTFTVGNAGPSTASNVNWTDVLPAGTTFVDFALISPGTPFTCALNPGPTVSCTAGSVLAGEFVTYTLTVGTDPGATGSITNTADVTTTTFDDDTANNSQTVVTTISLPTDLVAAKTGPATVTAGIDFTYTIGVRNDGPQPAHDVTLTDTLPAGVTFVSAAGCGNAGQTVTCLVGTLANGALVNRTIVVRPLLTNPFGTVLTNSVTVTSSTGELDPPDNTATFTSTQTGCTGNVGTPGNDVICPSANARTIQGGAGDDVLYGSPGGDTIQGGAGNDVLFGGGGNDTIQGGAGIDWADGGTGTDTCQQNETQTGCP